MDCLDNILKHNLAFNALLNGKGNIVVNDVSDEALLLTSAFLKLKRNIVVVKANQYEANMLYQKVMLLNEKDVSLFAVDESYRIEALAASPELLGQRIDTMYQLTKNEPRILITHSQAIIRHLPTKQLFIDNCLKIKVGMQIDIFPVETNVIPFLFRCICYFHGQVTNQVLFKWKKGGVVLFKLEKYIIIPLVRLLSRAMGRKNKNRYSYAYGLTWLKFFDGNVIYPTSDIIFEKHVFQGPNNPEEYLKIQYGNYMDLPPEEIRVGHKAQYVVFD